MHIVYKIYLHVKEYIIHLKVKNQSHYSYFIASIIESGETY